MYIEESSVLQNGALGRIPPVLRQMSQAVLAWIPFLFIAAVAGALSYIGVVTLYQYLTGESFRSGVLFISLVVLNVTALKPHCRCLLGVPSMSLRASQLPLIVGALCLILYRSSFYFHALDDFMFHMVAGFSFDSLWCEHNFMPLFWATYHLPLLQVIYSFSLESLGIRLSLLSLSLIQLVWFLSLNCRISSFIYPAHPGKRWIVDAIFALLYFAPELVLTHVTFMSDGYTVLFALEAAYTFISGGGFGLLCILIAGVFLTKQSALLFAPVAVLILGSRASKLGWSDIRVLLPLLISVGLFAGVSYLYTGNPLSYLFNGYFKSPLYDAGNFRDTRWGPLGWIEILSWPLWGTFSTRYVEFNDSTRLKPFFSLLLAVPFLWALLMGIFRRHLVPLIMLAALLLWAHQSGYGRYHLSITAVAWIFMLVSAKERIPSLRSSLLSLLIPLVVVAAGMMNFSRDYALRGSLFSSIVPPRLNPYTTDLASQGISLVGIDTPANIYARINGSVGQYDAVVVYDRGVSTLYGFLISYYRNVPLIQLGPDTQNDRVLDSSRVSPLIRGSLSRLAQFEKILVLVDKDHDARLFQSALKSNLLSGFDCSPLESPVLVPEFPHPNYFGYVTQRSCRKLWGADTTN